MMMVFLDHLDRLKWLKCKGRARDIDQTSSSSNEKSRPRLRPTSSVQEVVPEQGMQHLCKECMEWRVRISCTLSFLWDTACQVIIKASTQRDHDVLFLTAPEHAL